MALPNRNSKLKKNSQGLGDRLRNVVHEITNDVWGIERSIKANAKKYFTGQAAIKNIPVTALTIQIAPLSMFLCHQEEKLTPFTPADFIKFLGREELTPQVVEYHLHEFLGELSYIHTIPLENMVLRISMPDENIRLSVYQHSQFIAPIEIREILKWFAV
jgi:hypothetical protein